MSKPVTLEELVKKYLSEKPSLGKPDTYDLYKHSKGLSNAQSYSDSVASLYASSKRSLPSYGANNRIINNKGLQNSGYESYIRDAAKSKLGTELESLKSSFAKDEAKNRASYASYLESYKDKTDSTKRSVMKHLVSNGVVDLSTATAYGISAGLSAEDAALVGKSAYELTKQKVFNNLLDQTVRLGLDKEGARLLALKMGVSEEDASGFADEIDEMIDYYRNISEDYLEFLEQRSNKS